MAVRVVTATVTVAIAAIAAIVANVARRRLRGSSTGSGR